jgi:hypothetical protein
MSEMLFWFVHPTIFLPGYGQLEEKNLGAAWYEGFGGEAGAVLKPAEGHIAYSTIWASDVNNMLTMEESLRAENERIVRRFVDTNTYINSRCRFVLAGNRSKADAVIITPLIALPHAIELDWVQKIKPAVGELSKFVFKPWFLLSNRPRLPTEAYSNIWPAAMSRSALHQRFPKLC